MNEHGQVVSTGYNGMPIGCRDDDFSWGKNKVNLHQDKSSYGRLADTRS